MAQTPFMVSQEEVNGLFALANILDVGEVAHARCFLPPEITDGYLLPPTSRQCLTASAALFAALVDPTTAVSATPKPPVQAPTNSAEADVERGDVHATA